MQASCYFSIYQALVLTGLNKFDLLIIMEIYVPFPIAVPGCTN